jgi:hypothetical protein
MSASPLNLRKRFTAYRFLTGPDDAAFCHRVTKAINNGWSLYGPPTLTFDPAQGRAICGQAITKDVEGVDYTPDLKLGEL